MAFTGIFILPLPVDDQDRALAFYRDRIGMEVALDADLDDDWRMIMMKLPDTQTKIQFARRQEVRYSEEVPALYLECADVDAETERLKGEGVRFLMNPTELPWSDTERFAMFLDSEGNTVVIHATPPEG
ncbi:MAG: putative enzyme related to lactoylglutathione lyase [Limimaricola cinnabarinus]|jgi:predicted enzyme related to lactoylglutathione lyase|uniref:Lactoylglutathione lyase and related lyases n=1 Tax=Limimaricola cinnabarinus LL-001 TaxID=1337093 RepID=U2YIH3_9RHOB|nr:VOC family protein [Limimaricola cinnabarinus]GAD54541.1 lactoylglutathione lyase and related lyases [Limimaricola cinnabarinus LL-001]